ncbi:DUF1330 domain-containing protein [Ruegeria sp. EL01]|uniref:DUF1330 domain-containing protein n=1 Tax=Ruegeria sp. EL01 TaxID=2107578 RepID=UPI0013C427E7|nr:DUF1330 domain-containing protein [Ruegeria sp. EL01]
MTIAVLAMTSLKADGNEALETYLSVVAPLMQAAGARLISRYEVSQSLSGSELPHYVSIVEYPDDQALKMVFEHPDYIALQGVKDKAFCRYDVCVLTQAA